VRTFLRITLPLAAVNFLNQASRAVLALIGPLLALEFALSASDLGLLAAVLFVAYAATQLPVGVALDRYGPRRVQTVLTLTAALGFFLCAFAAGPLMLGVGRFITGIGISAGLMAMLKANTQWFPRNRVAAMTGSGVFVGALGGMAATLPMATILPFVGWRGGFLILGLLALCVAAWIWLSVADAPPGAAKPARRGLASEIAAFGPIFTHPTFLRFVPAIAVLSTMNFVYSGLWAGPWLRDVGGLDDAPRATILLVYAGGMAVGSILMGQLSSFLQQRGASAMLVPMLAVCAQLVIQFVFILNPPAGFATMAMVWFAFSLFGAAGPVGYAAVGQRFGAELAGRVATAINFSMLVLVFILQYVIGAILDLWPTTAAGGWDPAGYGWAMGLTAAMQAAALVWAWRAGRVLRA
jgi:predicted MFS family arabinose efflux permease